MDRQRTVSRRWSRTCIRHRRILWEIHNPAQLSTNGVLLNAGWGSTAWIACRYQRCALSKKAPWKTPRGILATDLGYSNDGVVHPKTWTVESLLREETPSQMRTSRSRSYRTWSFPGTGPSRRRRGGCPSPWTSPRLLQSPLATARSAEGEASNGVFSTFRTQEEGAGMSKLAELRVLTQRDALSISGTGGNCLGREVPRTLGWIQVASRLSDRWYAAGIN